MEPEIDESDLISTTEAAEILGMGVGAFAYFYKSGSIEFRLQRKPPPGKHSPTGYINHYSRTEILKIKEERDSYAIETGELMSIGEVEELTGYTRRSIKTYIKTKDFPVKQIFRGKSSRNFFERERVLYWMKEHEGEMPEGKHLINSTQAVNLSGYHWETLRKYIKMGRLRFEVFHRVGQHNKKSRTGSLGQGYWFLTEEVLQFKDWLDKKLQLSGHYLGNKRETNVPKDLRRPLDVPVLDSPPIKRTPKITEESIKSMHELEQLDSGKAAIGILHSLEKRMLMLLAPDVFLGAQEIYQLVQSLKTVKSEWKVLRAEGIEIEANGKLTKQILSLLEQRVEVASTSGSAASPLDVYYLAQASLYVRSECKKMKETEIADSGLSADELLLELNKDQVNDS